MDRPEIQLAKEKEKREPLEWADPTCWKCHMVLDTQYSTEYPPVISSAISRGLDSANYSVYKSGLISVSISLFISIFRATSSRHRAALSAIRMEN